MTITQELTKKDGVLIEIARGDASPTPSVNDRAIVRSATTALSDLAENEVWWDEDELSPAPSGGVGSGLWSDVSVVTVTDAVTLTTDAVGKLHLCSGTSANYTVMLPDAASCAGKTVQFQMSGALAKLVTLSSADLIDGLVNRLMRAGESAVLWSDGATWSKIAGRSIPFFCRVARNDGILVSNSNVQKINCDVTSNDPSQKMAVDGEVKILRDGVYSIKAQLQYSSVNASGGYQTRIHKNSTDTNNTLSACTSYVSAGSYPGLATGVDEKLITGDSVLLVAFQNSGADEYLYTSQPVNWLSVSEILSW